MSAGTIIQMRELLYPPDSCCLQPIRIFPVGQGMSAVCACFSPDGKQLAVGLGNGGIKGYEFHPAMRQVSAVGPPTRDTFGHAACHHALIAR